MTTGLVAIRITCPDGASAERIAAALVERRLAACAHVGPSVRSRYHWRGRIEAHEETLLELRTRAELFAAVAAAARALHPYETPAITAHPILAVDEAYGAWLDAETRGAA